MSFPSGVDVASYQTTTFPITGRSFVWVKATEGTSYVNAKHAAQVAWARQHGCSVGHYHFARYGSITEQVKYFLDHAALKSGDGIAFDWEDARVSSADKDAWLKEAQRLAPDHRVVLYCNRDFWFNHDKTSYCADGLWIADPSAEDGKPRIQHPWLFQQTSDANGLDVDIANFGSIEAMRNWFAKGKSVTPVVHAPKYEPFPGATWFKVGRTSPIVAAMHERLAAEGCSRYRSNTNKNRIGSGDVNSYEAWQRLYSKRHKKGWTGSALKWPPGKETWDALQVPNV